MPSTTKASEGAHTLTIFNYYFSESIAYGPVPEELMALAQSKRAELIATVADHDDELADIFLNEQDPTPQELKVIID